MTLDPPMYELSSAFRDQDNLASLFGSLNNISFENKRELGGGRGGGSEAVEGNMDANALIALSPYLSENVTSFNKGGQLSPKEYKKVAKLGRFGDTQLAHVTPEEANLLKALGGSGTINPYTGLPENFRFFKSLANIFMGGAKAAKSILDPVVENVVEPVFDAAGEVITPPLELTRDVLEKVGDDIVAPAVEGIAEGSTAALKGVGNMAIAGMQWLNDLIFGGGGTTETHYYNPYQESPKGMELKRGPMEQETQQQIPGVQMPGYIASNVRKSADPAELVEGDWVGDKENPFVTPNVEEEIDYAAKGMKMPRYNQGGHYLQQANQAVAMNQLSGLVANALQKRMPAQMPAANYGMKMKKRYTNGGRF